jgi:hypothetical protein
MRRRTPAEVNKLLINIAPAPTFWGIVAFNDRMPGCVEMFGCMLVRRRIATADMTAGAT